MAISLERGADLHTAQLMPLSLTVSCFSKIQIGFTFLVPAHPGSPGKRAANVCCHYLGDASAGLVSFLLVAPVASRQRVLETVGDDSRLDCQLQVEVFSTVNKLLSI